MNPLRIGIAGLGVISRFYLNALRRIHGVKLVAVCDRDEAKLAPFCAAELTTYTGFDDLVRDANIDAVVINLPNDLHFTACATALEAGKHVCCEKPLTLSFAEADALSGAAADAGRTLFTAFHRSYNVNFSRLLEHIARPSSVTRVDAWYLERIEEHAGDDLWYMNPHRSGGGCIADNGPNVFDLLTRVLGRIEITDAEVLKWVGGVDVEARVSLANAQGIVAEMHLDWAYPRGEAKGLAVELADGRRFTADLLAGFPEFKGSLRHEYVAILRDFARRVARGEILGTVGADAVRLVEDAYRIARSPILREVSHV